jgi:predicted HicB family RNase H-like nuclease
MINILQYKNYLGSVDYSDEDRVFHGKITMINDLITFEADSVSDLERSFRKSVDDYLCTCQKLNKISKC